MQALSRVVGDAHAVLGELRASRLDDLRDGEIGRGSDLGAEDAAQERLAHEAAADDADTHGAPP